MRNARLLILDVWNTRKPGLRSIFTAKPQTKRAEQGSPGGPDLTYQMKFESDALWLQMSPKADEMWSDNCSELLKFEC
ncbi:hypothetical protein B9Z55_027967 [Caenorhabditis nigoni]|uniref:Uncharacterized protein n=1 Tax=Caenorhabditis nigoni TaxID=1611254 RepID=A0A2G5SDD0_9PELO|nr:hypothetical protein B9Z55_027967 [Caenorhabditis nigoni]